VIGHSATQSQTSNSMWIKNSADVLKQVKLLRPIFIHEKSITFRNML